MAGEGMGAGGTGGVPPPPPLVVEVEEAAEKVAVCGVTCSGILVPGVAIIDVLATRNLFL